jgi:hypothetical protein
MERETVLEEQTVGVASIAPRIVAFARRKSNRLPD